MHTSLRVSERFDSERMADRSERVADRFLGVRDSLRCDSERVVDRLHLARELERFDSERVVDRFPGVQDSE